MADRPDRDLGLFARLLKQARLAKGVSQGSIAKTLGIAQASVSAWESGMAEPEREYVFALEDILGTGDGGLSWPLNYGRVPKSLERSQKNRFNTRQAITADPDLSDAAKDVLLRNYTLLKSRNPRTAKAANQSSECITADSRAA